jgi:hypothetical protein
MASCCDICPWALSISSTATRNNTAKNEKDFKPSMNNPVYERYDLSAIIQSGKPSFY